ncbi:hypothetical protein [Streptomyces sp. AK04-3B]|uniref:hypothetical protein n=1 Tax=unclassified Streptomyces TaxID=2593676 RepID=UPI0029AE668E|nr:hypothetical protein [Streptomyces sp. AK04-3B]MDX3797762.1 hypothetical protein [Streptomyces sp. AK04-3B]
MTARQPGPTGVGVGVFDAAARRIFRGAGKADGRQHTGDHHNHGLHVLAVTDEKGHLPWTSSAGKYGTLIGTR